MMILLIVLLGLVLRLISLNQSLWLDEATSALVAKNFSVSQILTKFLPGDFHPPFYYLAAHFWVKLFGASEIGIRSLSVLSGVITIYVVYRIATLITNHRSPNTGLIASLLLATSGLHIYYSQEARMYCLATLFVSLTFLYFVKILKKGRVGDWLFFSLFLTLSVFTDYLPVLIIPVLWVSAWLVKKDFLWWKKFFVSHIILIITGLLWLPTFIKQFESGLSIKSDSPSWWQFFSKKTWPPAGLPFRLVYYILTCP
jgi:uncharacterized membrane protein